MTKGKSVYNVLMDTLFIAPSATLSDESLNGSLEADLRHLEAMVPQMAAVAQAAQVDAHARLAALHARIAQDIATLRESEACTPSSR